MKYALLALLSACTTTRPYVRTCNNERIEQFEEPRRHDEMIPLAPKTLGLCDGGACEDDLVFRYYVPHNPDDLPELDPVKPPAEPEPSCERVHQPWEPPQYDNSDW